MYKAHGELEDALGVANANVRVVMMNCEMLEEALRREAGGSVREVGWRRGGNGTGTPTTSMSGSTTTATSLPSKAPGVKPTLERSQSIDVHPEPTTPSSTTSEGRFFKFRFSSATPITPSPAIRGAGSMTRPTTPSNLGHLNSPSLPVLPLRRVDGEGSADEDERGEGKKSRASIEGGVLEREREKMEKERLEKEKEREEKERTLLSSLESERKLKAKALEEKAELEAELESLSQALFEEANKMVADERRAVEEERQRAEEERKKAEEMRRLKEEREEEVEELRKEKEALRSALRVIEGENVRLSESMRVREESIRTSMSREDDGDGNEEEEESSSVKGMKSPPRSPTVSTRRRLSDLGGPSPWADS